MRKIYYLLFSVTLLASCKKPDVNNTSNEITSENISSETIETVIYKIGNYNAISNKSIVNIEISNNIPKDEIHLISTKQNLEQIKFEIIDGELILSHKNKSFTTKNNIQIIAKINSDNISKFNISGLGYINSEVIQKAENIEIKIEGAGNLELTINNHSISNKIEGLGNISLKGRTNKAKTEIEGAGNLDAFELETNSTIVTIEGLGNANVNVSEKLEATISGAGNLTYKGNPKEIIKDKSGLGSINRYEVNQS